MDKARLYRYKMNLLALRYSLAAAFICVQCIAFSQSEVELINPSFEGKPSRGQTLGAYKLISGWEDWELFMDQSPPDVHGRGTNYWNVQREPYDGICFIGLVTRSNQSWECFGQKLVDPLKGGTSYVLTLYLSRDYNYASPINPNSGLVKFTSPTIVRIWGSHTVATLDEMLDQSEPITHEDWEQYTFHLKPSKDLRYLVIEAYFASEFEPGNGHVLIDNAKLVLGAKG